MLTIKRFNALFPGTVFEGDAYNYGMLPPHYPVPAIRNHLDLIAAEPLTGWEDFKALGYWGKRPRNGNAWGR